MIRYKNYKLIVPDVNQRARIEKIIDENKGSVFHDVFLNQHVSDTFKTNLFYLVDDVNQIENFSPVHQIKEKNGLIRYQFRPLFDIPYAGFVGNDILDLTSINTGFFESFKYEGFPYYDSVLKNDESSFSGLTSILDLSISQDEIFEKIIHSKKRNKIRKALKEGIEVRIFTEKKGMEIFWDILKPLHDKFGFNNSLNFEYYNSIFKHYSKLKKAFILIAFKEDKPISGVFILGNQNYMHYYKGASLSGFQNEGQGELLQWEAIKHSKSLGTKYYDLCNLNKDKLPGIYQFKTGICNHLVKYPIYGKNNLGFKILNRIK